MVLKIPWILLLKGTPWGLEYTFSSALFVTIMPIHIPGFDAYMPTHICNCLRCSLIAFSASWSRSMCKFQQFLFESTRSQGVPLTAPSCTAPSRPAAHTELMPYINHTRSHLLPTQQYLQKQNNSFVKGSDCLLYTSDAADE